MRKLREKIICVSLAFATIVSFTGCGNGGSGADASKIANDQFDKYLSNEVTIDFECIWTGKDSKAEYVGQMIEAFNKENEGKYHVNVIEQTDYDTYQSKLDVQINAGQVPDVFTMKSYTKIKQYADDGKLMDFSNYIGQESQSSKFLSGVLDEYKSGNGMYCIPYESGVIPIMYNMELLRGAGIENPPTSWEEFFQDCDTLKAKGINATSFMTGANAWTAQLWYAYAVAATVGKDAWNGDMTGDQYVKAAEMVKKIYSYAPSDAIGSEAVGVNNHFYNKEAAIYTNGSWILGGIKKNAGQDFYNQVQVTPGLSNEGANGNSYIRYIQAFLCAAKQENPEKQKAVEAFIDYITNPDRVTELSNASGSTFCVNVDAAKITDPLQKQIISDCSNADFTIKNLESSVSPDAAKAFPAALEAYVTDKISVQDFLKELQSPPAAK